MTTNFSSRTRARVGVFVALFGAICLAHAQPVRAEAAAARQVVEQTVNEVLAILAKKDLPTETRREQIEAIVDERFDFYTMSRLILARNYKRFSEQQRVDFVVEFRMHLSRSYGRRIDRYQQEGVEISGERLEPRGDVTILTLITGGQFNGTEVHYRLRERDANWRMIDVVIEGVSLVSNFRSQFQEVVSNSGPEGLLERLREKNALPEEELEDDFEVAS